MTIRREDDHPRPRRREVHPEDVHVAAVIRHDGPIVLPQSMDVDEAIDVLIRKRDYDQEEVCIKEAVPVFPWDGALALAKALEEQFGMAQQQSGFMTMAGKMSVDVGPNKTKSVPWGQFQLPGIPGFVEATTTQLEGRVVFQVHAHIQHQHEEAIRKLIARTREIAKVESIYRGQAIQIRFTDESGARLELPTPKFLALSDAQVIFNRGLEAAIETSFLTPIRYSQACRDNGVPLKRGALLAGPYGTGKTLTANLVAREAVKHGWTFIYVTDVEELADALKFAQAYQPAVVFAEDIDRMAGVERTDDVNELLNILDGIGSKKDEVITILTSNHPDRINPAMRRPGRIDLVLPIDAPDAEAVERLVRLYGQELAGQIPAVIREVIERSKLEAIKRMHGTAESFEIAAMDLMAAARVLKTEQGLFKPADGSKDPMQAFGEGFGRELGSVLGPHISSVIKLNRTEGNGHETVLVGAARS